MQKLVDKLKQHIQFADYEVDGKIHEKIKLMLGPVKDFKRA
jgi:hypothetical protein